MGKSRRFNSYDNDVANVRLRAEQNALSRQNAIISGTNQSSPLGKTGLGGGRNRDSGKLPLKGGFMIGSIGFEAESIAISTGDLDISTSDAAAAIIPKGIVFVTPESGTTDTLDTITGKERAGQILILTSITGNTITITHNDAGAGRILCPDDANYILSDDESVTLMDDITGSDSWRIIGTSDATGLGGSQTPWESDIVAAGFDLNDLSNIEFRDTTGVPLTTIRAIYATASTMFLNVPTADTIQFNINGDPIADAIVISSNNAFRIHSSANGALPILTFRNDDTTPTSGVQVGRIGIFGRDSGATQVEYGRIRVDSEDITAASKDGSMHLEVLENSVAPAATTTTFLSLNNASSGKINFWKNLQAQTGVDIEMVENDIWLDETADGTGIRGTSLKIEFDVGGTEFMELSGGSVNIPSTTTLQINELFKMNATVVNGGVDGEMWHDSGTGNILCRSGGAERNLSDIGGGGVSFPIIPTVDVRGSVSTNQAVDISQTDGHVTTMTLAGNITVTFSGFPSTGNQQTWELHVLQDATGGRTLTISPTPVETVTIASGANLLTILTFLTNDGGTDIHAIPALRGSISLSGNFLPLAGGTMTGDITMSGADIIVGNNDLLTVKDIQFQNGGTITAGTSMIVSDASGDMILNVADADQIFLDINNERRFQVGLIGGNNDSFAQITSKDNAEPLLKLFRDDSTMTAGVELGRLEFLSNDGGGVAMLYADITVDTENVTAANEAGSLHLGVAINGDTTTTTFLSLNNADDDKITPWKNIHMAAGIDVEMVTNDIWLDEVADATRISGTATALNMHVGGTFVSSYSSSALSLQGNTTLAIGELFTLATTAASPAGSINAIWADTGGMNLNIGSTEIYDFFINGTSVLQIDPAGGFDWSVSGVGHSIDAGATTWSLATGASTDAINLRLLNSTHEFQITDTAITWQDPVGPLIFSMYLNDLTVAASDVQNVGTLQWRANNDVGTETNVLSINPQVIVSNDTDWQTRTTISAGTSVGNILLGSDDAAAKVGFYNTGPVVQQTGVAVTAAGIHAALVNLGLITA